MTTPSHISRRQLLHSASLGFGAMALPSLSHHATLLTDPSEHQPGPHHRPRARSIIFLYMDGGPSQVDTFDPKPRLTAESGQPFKMKMEPTQFENNGLTLGSPWTFKQYGESGIPVSELFPNVATQVDKLAVVRSMTSQFSEHTTANYFLHTGLGLQGRPSLGSWILYGLGSENRDLPGHIVLNGGLIPPGGLDNFTSSFLPANFQGSIFKTGALPLANIRPREKKAHLQPTKLDLLRRLDRGLLERIGSTPAIEAAIANQELAFRMQAAVPELMDISRETAATRSLYGIDAEFVHTRTFATQCLLARRLVERGVRFIELTCPQVKADRWDQHSNLLGGHTANALAVDRPIAALLIDLERRGLLDDTLVIWTGEFGRTPFAQGTNGRDHNPFAFSSWLAGGGIKGGTVYGTTDEYGYKVVENPVEMYDLHATILHLLGIDHERLTYRWSGRDIRLTDVYGKIVRAILS